MFSKNDVCGSTNDHLMVDVAMTIAADMSLQDAVDANVFVTPPRDVVTYQCIPTTHTWLCELDPDPAINATPSSFCTDDSLDFFVTHSRPRPVVVGNSVRLPSSTLVHTLVRILSYVNLLNFFNAERNLMVVEVFFQLPDVHPEAIPRTTLGGQEDFVLLSATALAVLVTTLNFPGLLDTGLWVVIGIG